MKRIKIKGTERTSKRGATYPIYKKDIEDIPERPEPEEKPTIKEVEAKEETSSKITPAYVVLWNKKMRCLQIIRIEVSNENFLKNILEGLNKNLARFEWSPIVWCENPEHTEISAIGKINEKNVMELENFIDEIKSNYSD